MMCFSLLLPIYRYRTLALLYYRTGMMCVLLSRNRRSFVRAWAVISRIRELEYLDELFCTSSDTKNKKLAIIIF